MVRLGRTTSFVAAAALLWACSSDSPQGQQPQQRAATPPPIAPTTAQDEDAELADFRYDPTGKPDPFRSFVKLQEDLEDGITTPLERFDLTQLEVTAIIWGHDEPRALIKDPAGKGHIVAAGTPIGKNQGRIVATADLTSPSPDTFRVSPTGRARSRGRVIESGPLNLRTRTH